MEGSRHKLEPEEKGRRNFFTKTEGFFSILTFQDHLSVKFLEDRSLWSTYTRLNT